MKRFTGSMSFAQAIEVITKNSQDYGEVAIANAVLKRVMKNIQSTLDKSEAFLKDKEAFLKASDGEPEFVVQDKLGAYIYKLNVTHKYDIDKDKLDLSTLPAEFVETKTIFKLKEMKIAAAKGDTRGNINEALIDEEVSSFRSYEVDPVTLKMKK